MDDNDDARQLARLEVQVYHLMEGIKEIKSELDHYVRLTRFRPTELAVWGLVSLLCGSLITAVLSKVLH